MKILIEFDDDFFFFDWLIVNAIGLDCISECEPLARCMADVGSLHGRGMDDGVVVDRHRRQRTGPSARLPQRSGPAGRHGRRRTRRIFHLPHYVQN